MLLVSDKISDLNFLGHCRRLKSRQANTVSRSAKLTLPNRDHRDTLFENPEAAAVLVKKAQQILVTRFLPGPAFAAISFSRGVIQS
jgi:hypothetical protein